MCVTNREDLREQLAEVEAFALDEDEKNRKRSKFHTKLAPWSPKGRSVVGITVLAEDGSPTNDKDSLRPLSRTGSLSLIMLLGIVVLLIVSLGSCRSALRGLSPYEGGFSPYLWCCEEVCPWS